MNVFRQQTGDQSGPAAQQSPRTEDDRSAHATAATDDQYPSIASFMRLCPPPGQKRAHIHRIEHDRRIRTFLYFVRHSDGHTFDAAAKDPG